MKGTSKCFQLGTMALVMDHDQTTEASMFQQGSDSSNLNTSEEAQITDSIDEKGASSPPGLQHEGGSNTPNLGDQDGDRVTDLKALFPTLDLNIPSQTCSSNLQSARIYASETCAPFEPVENANDSNYIAPTACEHHQGRREIDLIKRPKECISDEADNQQLDDNNEAKVARGQLQPVALCATVEPPLVCRHRPFDLNHFPDADEEDLSTSPLRPSKDERTHDIRQTSSSTATRPWFQNPNRTSAFFPYDSNSRNHLCAIGDQMQAQNVRSHQLARAPPQTQLPDSPSKRPVLPPGLILSMNAVPSPFGNMVAAVSLPPGRGRRRLVAAAATGSSTIGPPLMSRARGPKTVQQMVQTPAHLFVHYGPGYLQTTPQLLQGTQQEPEALQLFPPSS